MHELSNILIELIFILLHFCVFLGNYSVAGKNLFYPAVLFSLIWTVILLLHFIFGLTILDELYPLTIETYLVIFVGTLCFSFGAFIVAIFQKQKTSSEFTSEVRVDKEFKVSLAARTIFLVIVIIGIPFYIQAAYRVFIASQIDNFFVGLRTELSYGEEDIGPIKYLVSFSFVVFAVNYFASIKEDNKLNKILFLLSFILAVVYAVFATGRTYFFMLLAIYLGISYLHKKNFSLKKYAWSLFIFIPVFVFIGMIYGKGGDTEGSFKDNIKASSETTAIYLVSSVNAFDYEVRQHASPNYHGDNTLLFFAKIGKQFNLIPDKKLGSLLSEFVYIPYATNVFTFYSPYMRDYGRLYAWIMIAMFGALHTWIFQRAVKTKNLRNSLYYSFLLYPLLMSFFQDQYMSLFSTWLQVVFYIELFLVLNLFLESRKWKWL